MIKIYKNQHVIISSNYLGFGTKFSCKSGVDFGLFAKICKETRISSGTGKCFGVIFTSYHQVM